VRYVLLTSVPNLDEIARDPGRALGLAIETIAGLLAKHAAVGNALGAALLLSKSNAEPSAPVDEDQTWLTPDEAAPILRRKRRWIYRNAARCHLCARSRGAAIFARKKASCAGWSARRFE
jgi:hypothetical protein